MGTDMVFVQASSGWRRLIHIGDYESSKYGGHWMLRCGNYIMTGEQVEASIDKVTCLRCLQAISNNSDVRRRRAEMDASPVLKAARRAAKAALK